MTQETKWWLAVGLIGLVLIGGIVDEIRRDLRQFRDEQEPK